MTGLKTAIPLNLFTMKLRINPPPLENNDIGSMNDKATISVLKGHCAFPVIAKHSFSINMAFWNQRKTFKMLLEMFHACACFIPNKLSAL